MDTTKRAKRNLNTTISLNENLTSILSRNQRHLTRLIRNTQRLASFIITQSIRTRTRVANTRNFNLARRVPRQHRFTTRRPSYQTRHGRRHRRATSNRLGTSTPNRNTSFNFQRTHRRQPQTTIRQCNGTMRHLQLITPRLTFTQNFNRVSSNQSHLVRHLRTNGQRRPFTLFVRRHRQTDLTSTGTLRINRLHILHINMVRACGRRNGSLAANIPSQHMLNRMKTFRRRNATSMALPNSRPYMDQIDIVRRNTSDTNTILLTRKNTSTGRIFTTTRGRHNRTNNRLLRFISFLRIIIRRFTTRVRPQHLRTNRTREFIQIRTRTHTRTLFRRTTRTLNTFARHTIRNTRLVNRRTHFANRVLFTNNRINDIRQARNRRNTTTSSGHRCRNGHGA